MQLILKSPVDGSAEDVMLYSGTEMIFLSSRCIQFICGTTDLSKETASRLFSSVLIHQPVLWGWINQNGRAKIQQVLEGLWTSFTLCDVHNISGKIEGTSMFLSSRTLWYSLNCNCLVLNDLLVEVLNCQK